LAAAETLNAGITSGFVKVLHSVVASNITPGIPAGGEYAPFTS
jgi:hypothetical protein